MRDIFNLAYSVRMQAEGSDTAEIMLYGEIIDSTRFKWSDDDKSASEFDKEIKEAKKAGAKKLLLRINSPGGVCTQSVAMRSILANAGFEKIDIRIEGMCASAATDIATLPGAHVAISEGSEYMIHNPWCISYGNANDFERVIERLRNIESVTRGFYAKRTGKSDEQIKEWMDAETWFTAEQAVENGFADEIISAESEKETPAAACVTNRVMETMRSLYKSVPDQIVEADKPETPAAPEAPKDISNDAPVAGASPEINNQNEEEQNNMDIKDINVEQLGTENPALLAEIQQRAVAAERQRQSDIDALTLPGYEQMAAKAKEDGTSALDFQRQLVKAVREKGNDFLQKRREETKPAQEVAGGEPSGNKNDEQEIQNNAKSIAAYAKELAGGNNDTMF